MPGLDKDVEAGIDVVVTLQNITSINPPHVLLRLIRRLLWMQSGNTRSKEVLTTLVTISNRIKSPLAALKKIRFNYKVVIFGNTNSINRYILTRAIYCDHNWKKQIPGKGAINFKVFLSLTQWYQCTNSQVGLDLGRILEFQFFADNFFTFSFFY